MFLHMQDGMERQGLNPVVIHTVDTDVVVLGISAVSQRDALKLFIAFRAQKNFRYINVNNLAIFLGNEKSKVLPIFHAFTVSFFAGRGKKSAMNTWPVYESLTPVLSNPAKDPDALSDDDFAVIEQFVVYRTSDDLTVNAARNNLFCKKGCAIENILPTQAALLQHLLRSMYPANCWLQMCVKSQKLLDPGSFGWECIDGKWTPLWTKLPKVADSSRILVKCGCKKSCNGNCKCRKAVLDCTAPCNCGGSCN